MKAEQILPKLIRFRDAPAYLGMDRHCFNREVRPNITEIPIGSRGIAFDRLDLDAWANDYKRCSGRPAVSNERGTQLWGEKERQVSINAKASGTLIKRYSNSDFQKALALVKSKKQKNTSQDALRS